MIVKSDDLRRTLFEIDNLLQTMRVAGVQPYLDHDDIDFLQRSRRSIVALLEARRTLNRHSVVSLKGWRYGMIAPQLTAQNYAATVRTSQLGSSIPRPYFVS